MPRRRRFYPPAGESSAQPVRASESGKSIVLLKPDEAGERLGMSASEVLVLPGLWRVALSEQRVRYTEDDIDAFIHSKRRVQGFLSTSIGSWLYRSHHPLPTAHLAELLRVRASAVGTLLEASAPYYPPVVLEHLAARYSVQPE